MQETMTRAPPPDPATTFAGALALEAVPGRAATCSALAQAGAGELAALVARDIAVHAPEAASLDLALVAAHYDPVELLRPGWPLHAHLAQLAQRAPRDGDTPRIIAFGAHAGALPEALRVSDDYAGGPLRVLPFVLSGDPAVVARVGRELEGELVERGMAAADTALLAQSAFGLPVEHARYLTLHDLCAMTALQYDHMGLAPLWPVLETALLSPGRDAMLDTPPDPLLRYRNGEVLIALFAPHTWRARYCPEVGDEALLARRFAQFEARQRQFASVLSAHGVPVTFAQCDSGRVDAL
jgi:hypothetical protein